MIEGMRWVRVWGDPENGVVCVKSPGWPECGDSLYKLQYLNLLGEWCDVEIAE